MARSQINMHTHSHALSNYRLFREFLSLPLYRFFTFIFVYHEINFHNKKKTRKWVPYVERGKESSFWSFQHAEFDRKLGSWWKKNLNKKILKWAALLYFLTIKKFELDDFFEVSLLHYSLGNHSGVSKEEFRVCFVSKFSIELSNLSRLFVEAADIAQFFSVLKLTPIHSSHPPITFNVISFKFIPWEMKKKISDMEWNLKKIVIDPKCGKL